MLRPQSEGRANKCSEDCKIWRKKVLPSFRHWNLSHVLPLIIIVMTLKKKIGIEVAKFVLPEKGFFLLFLLFPGFATQVKEKTKKKD